MFPHKLEKSSGDNWIYEDDDSNKTECEALVLTSKAWYVGLWHNCTLLCTQRVQHESEKFRISLRYLIGKLNTNLQKTIIDEINFTITGNLQPEKKRLDIDSLGKAIMKGNIINTRQKLISQNDRKRSIILTFMYLCILIQAHL